MNVLVAGGAGYIGSHTVKRLKEAGRNATYIEQPEGDHHFTREADRLEFLKALEDFLAKYNPA